ncbi:hypothetical protein D3C85_1390260 [compost metagenome]
MHRTDSAGRACVRRLVVLPVAADDLVQNNSLADFPLVVQVNDVLFDQDLLANIQRGEHRRRRSDRYRAGEVGGTGLQGDDLVRVDVFEWPAFRIER